jgi:hypothetical protein
MEAQGYTIDTNVVYQDNMSTLSLAKNGYVSSSKRTKHIKAKYLYIRHYHKSGELIGAVIVPEIIDGPSSVSRPILTTILEFDQRHFILFICKNEVGVAVTCYCWSIICKDKKTYISRSAEGREDISFIKSMYARGGNNQGQCSQFEKVEHHGLYRFFLQK